MPRRRVRRPLLALIVLVLALIIGYTVQALHSDDHPAPSAPPSAVSTH